METGREIFSVKVVKQWKISFVFILCTSQLKYATAPFWRWELHKYPINTMVIISIVKQINKQIERWAI
jgi:hypothetical protein